MDRKSTAMVVAVVIAVAAASYLAMEMDDTWNVGSEEDGYKVTLKLTIQEGLKCTVGDREYHDGDSLVFYDDTILKITSPTTGTIKCFGGWSTPDGAATSGGSAEEYGTQMEFDLTWTAFFGDMSGTLTVTFVAGDPAN